MRERRTRAVTLALIVMASTIQVISPIRVEADPIPGSTQRIAADEIGEPRGIGGAAISTDGRYIAFASSSGLGHLYRRDRLTGRTEMVDVAPDDVTAGNNQVGQFAMSRNGRWVAFGSQASNLVSGDTNGFGDIFLRDMDNSVTKLVSVSTTGQQGNHSSAFNVALADDGRYVAFSSAASNLTAAVSTGYTSIFRKDMQTGAVALVSTTDGAPTGNSDGPQISADGQRIAFESDATNLVNARSSTAGVFLWDAVTGLTLLSQGSLNGQTIQGGGFAGISGDGKTVLFGAVASAVNFALVAYDVTTGKLAVAGTDPTGNPLANTAFPVSSFDGREVAFASAVRLTQEDNQGRWQIYVLDRSTNTIRIASASDANQAANVDTGSTGPGGFAISADGLTVAFGSFATNLVLNDANGVSDEFLRGPSVGLANCQASVPVATSPALPTVGTPPALTPTSIRIGKGSPSDPVLERPLTITGTKGSAALAGYDYGWSSNGTATCPDQGVIAGHVAASGLGWLDYSLAGPADTWYLFVRARDVDGLISPWVAVPEKTPPAPIVVALGDSITSGHHFLPTDGVPICNDGAYSYASSYAAAFQISLPTQWRTSDPDSAYRNFAYSGFSTDQVLKSGFDTCNQQQPSDTSHGKTPIGQAMLALKEHRGSWNQVVITAGIDDTNWTNFTGPVATIIAANHVRSSRLLPFTSLECNAIVRTIWDGYQTDIQRRLSVNVASIAHDLLSSGRNGGDPLTHVHWLSYFDISGTGPVPPQCHSAVTAAMGALTSVVRASLPSAVNWVDLNPALGQQADRLQSQLPNFNLKAGFRNIYIGGWPHPLRPEGTDAIAALIPF